jgi:biopolymer transport protein ExbD
MKFDFQSQERRIDLTVLPMVNVVFLLLVFFMLVGRVGPKEELDVAPPLSQSDQLESGQPLRIEIDRAGIMALDGKIVDTTELIIAVSDLVRQAPQTRLQLKADAGLEANRLIKIMETLRLIGVAKLTLLTERDS